MRVTIFHGALNIIQCARYSSEATEAPSARCLYLGWSVGMTGRLAACSVSIPNKLNLYSAYPCLCPRLKLAMRPVLLDCTVVNALCCPEFHANSLGPLQQIFRLH